MFKKMITACLLLRCLTQADVAFPDPLALQASNGLLGDGLGASVIISSSGTNTIRFFQFFFYNASDTLLGTTMGSIIDNIYGLSFTNGQKVSFDSGSLYQIATNAGVDTAAVASMQLYMDGAAQSSSGVPCQTFTESCSGSACTSSGAPNSATWGTNPTICTSNRYAYISENTSSTHQIVYRCEVDPNSSYALDNCVLEGPSSPPYLQLGTLGDVISNGYAYFSNTPSNNAGGAGSSSVVSICKMDQTGAISTSSCSTGYTAATGASSRGIAISAGYLYDIDTISGVIPCSISAANGTLTCSGTALVAASQLNNPRGLALNNAYLYITNSSGGTGSILICPLSTTNPEILASSCSTSSAASSYVSAPSGITVYDNYLYFVNNSWSGTGQGNAGGIVTYCPINSDGSLGSCANAGAPVSLFHSSGPNGIAIYNGYVYITDTTNGLVQCQLKTDHSINGSSCAATGNVTFTKPVGISIF